MRLSRHKPSVAILVLGAATALAFSSVSAQTSGRTVRPVDDAETKPKLERVTAPTKVPEAVTRSTSVVGTPVVPQHSAPSRSPEQAATGAGMGRGPSAKEAAAVGGGRPVGTGSAANPVGQGPAVELAAPAAVTTPDVPRTVDARPSGQPSAADLKKRQVKPPVQVQVMSAPPVEAYLPVLGPQSNNEPTQQSQQNLSAIPAGTPLPRSGFVVPVGAAHITGLSGKQGEHKRTVDLHDYDMFIHRVVWKEDKDRPCLIYIEGAKVMRDQNGSYLASGDTLFKSEVFDCDAEPDVRIPIINVDLLGGQTKSVSTEALRPVSAIRVCNNRKSNSRMKGLRVNGSHIAPWDPNAAMSQSSDSAEMSNCGDWGTVQLCAADMRATGVVVHARGRGSITGLELICRKTAVR